MSLGLIIFLFALLFEYLPERHIAWRDIWLGATVTGALFVLGQFLLAWYIASAGLSSGYGSFGGLIVFLVWVYYSARLVLFAPSSPMSSLGTMARYGRLRPKPGARRLKLSRTGHKAFS